MDYTRRKAALSSVVGRVVLTVLKRIVNEMAYSTFARFGMYGKGFTGEYQGRYR